MKNKTLKIIYYLFIIYFLVIPQAQADSILGPSLKYKDVVVERVINMSVLKLADGEKIRLIGIKSQGVLRRRANEIKTDSNGFIVDEPASPTISVETQGFEYLKQLVEGQHVRIELDALKTDDDFITLGYVFLLKNNIFVNVELLRNGYAEMQIRVPNTKYELKLRQAFQEARREQRGLQGE
ncbi:MAG: thermonuclease family protein [Candidatus Omnitrophica bacterium]|nr:thermonuclease family protein [Candidatus Omnitrophota bacterium]